MDGFENFLAKYPLGKKHLFAKSRLATFNNWPFDAAVKGCTSVKLAEAGFIYSGQAAEDTSASCVFCAKDLEFEDDDNPWEEHKKRCPECPFVKTNKLDERTLTIGDLMTHAGHAHMIAMRKIIDETVGLTSRAEADVVAEIMNVAPSAKF